LIAVDTSVAVPALLGWHTAHSAARRAARGAAIPAHALVETYSVLTRLPAPHRVESHVAESLLSGWFPGRQVLAVPADIARSLVRRLAAAGVEGGAAYDGVLALTAAAHRAELVTRDRRAATTYEALGVRYRLIAD
jgi:predicted nucleic acid-binding protein